MANYKVIRVKQDVRTRFNRFSAWVQDRTGNKVTDNEAVSSLLEIADLVRKEEANIAAETKGEKK